mgnify:CR=1 FL=1
MSVFIAVLLVASLAGPFVSVGAAVPSGMVTVPDANVSEDVPVGSDPEINASRLEGNVMASEHGESLQVVVTTPDRASDYLENGSVAGSSGSLALVLKDDTHSEGRRVAIGAEAVREALGYTPQRVYGTHEDGSKWSRAVEYEAGMLVFHVPHFSSNTITFSGEVSISGMHADGSTVTYDLADVDTTTDPNITLTGALATETETESKTLSPDNTLSTSLAGNAEPLGPDGSGDPEVTITPKTTVLDVNPSGDSYSLSDSELPDRELNTIVAAGMTEGSYGDGTRTFTVEITVDGTVVGSKDFSMDSGTPWEYKVDGLAISSPSSATMTITSGTADAHLEDDDEFHDAYTQQNADGSGSISADTGQSVSFDTSTGQSVTKQMDLSTATSSLSVSSNGGDYDLSVSYTERTETVDPSVSVNGEVQASFSGVLADGSTANFTGNNSVLQSGTNTVNVSVGDGSLSGDAPTPSVDLNYTHDAQDKQSVNFTANKWSESYNVSKTFASDRSSANLTIPFAGEVVGIENIEKRVNGGTWSTVSQDSYSLKGTKLTVDIGPVNGGDTVEVRTTGRRVNVIGGSITVTEPTVKGDRLDTKIRLDSWSTDSHISVGATPDARRVHYAYQESWSNADPYSKITADGYNYVYLPAAESGGEARISTIPVSVNPTSGEVRLSVNEPRTEEPQFSVRPGDQEGDTVEYTYITASDGTHYVLKSKTNDVVRADGTANSPLTLEDDDSAETLVFLKDTVSSDSGPVGPVDVGGDSGDPLSSPTVVVMAWGLLTAGFYVMHRRIGGPSGLRIPFVGAVPFPGGVITAVGSVGSGLLILEFYSGRVSKALAGVIESIGPIAGIAAVGIAVWWAYNQFRGRPVVINSK